MKKFGRWIGCIALQHVKWYENQKFLSKNQQKKQRQKTIYYFFPF
jgi:hypothetical protein